MATTLVTAALLLVAVATTTVSGAVTTLVNPQLSRMPAGGYEVRHPFSMLANDAFALNPSTRKGIQGLR